jgi:DNA-directed RNA polymerase subunit RPC12/RpoP
MMPAGKKLKLAAAAILAAAGVAALVYELRQGPQDQSRTYDYQCTNCQYRFRRHVKSGIEDMAVIECPKCKQIAAEKIMHYQCRKCWTKYDLRASHASLANVVCPACGSRAARNLDHLIPGDNEPAEGGKPYPGD